MTRALLVIDVQESFRQRSLWAAISNPDIARDVARLVDGARAAGDLVIWVLHAEPGSGTPFDPESGHVCYLEPLAPEPGDPQLVKTSHNAFTTTGLQQLLTQRRQRAGDLRHKDRAVLRDHRAGRLSSCSPPDCTCSTATVPPWKRPPGPSASPAPACCAACGPGVRRERLTGRRDG